jgi:recombination protein RecA
VTTSPQIEDLRTLLRKQGFGSSLPAGAPQPYPPAGTGFAGLDDLLGGGIPRGQITELAGPASSGCTSLVLSTLAESTTRGEVAAYIDATDCFDPPSGEKAGIVLERLLWVRCGNSRDQRNGSAAQRINRTTAKRNNGSTAQRLNHSTAHDQPWRAVNLVADAGGFGVVVLDLGGLSGRQLRAWQSRPWMRLLHLIRGSSTALIVLTAQPLASSVSTVVLELSRQKTHWTGGAGVSLLLNGISIQARAVRHRRQGHS